MLSLSIGVLAKNANYAIALVIIKAIIALITAGAIIAYLSKYAWYNYIIILRRII